MNTSSSPSLNIAPGFLNRVIEDLKAGRVACAGESFTFFDCEHEPYLLDVLAQKIDASAKILGEDGRPARAPFVRIPAEGDQDFRWIVKQVLERGAMGVIAPYIENAEQALKFVECMRYPLQNGDGRSGPQGRRSWGGMPSTWGATAPEYLRRADVWPLNPAGELLALPMIESASSVERIDEILDVPGISFALIGVNDLSLSYGEGLWPAGLPMSKKPEVMLSAIQKIAAACDVRGKYCAMPSWSDEETQYYLDLGVRIICPFHRPGASASKPY
jgi:4-hydroxy-2-oxoheptanedioate aldolase